MADERYWTRRRRLLVLAAVALVVAALYLQPAPNQPWLAVAAFGLSVAFAVLADYLVFTLPRQDSRIRSIVRQVAFFAVFCVVLAQYLAPVAPALVFLVVTVSLLLAVAAERLYVTLRRSASQSAPVSSES